MAIKKYNADDAGKDAVPLWVIDAVQVAAPPRQPHHQPAPEPARREASARGGPAGPTLEQAQRLAARQPGQRPARLPAGMTSEAWREPHTQRVAAPRCPNLHRFVQGTTPEAIRDGRPATATLTRATECPPKQQTRRESASAPSKHQNLLPSTCSICPHSLAGSTISGLSLRRKPSQGRLLEQSYP